MTEITLHDALDAARRYFDDADRLSPAADVLPVIRVPGRRPPPLTGQLRVLADAGDHLAFVLAVLDVAARAGCHEYLHYRVGGDRVALRFCCAGLFAPRTRHDAEEITVEDLPLLRTCLDDLAPYRAGTFVPELYAARRRGMRPTRRFLFPTRENDDWPHVRDLFLACVPGPLTSLQGPA